MEAGFGGRHQRMLAVLAVNRPHFAHHSHGECSGEALKGQLGDMRAASAPRGGRISSPKSSLTLQSHPRQGDGQRTHPGPGLGRRQPHPPWSADVMWSRFYCMVHIWEQKGKKTCAEIPPSDEKVEPSKVTVLGQNNGNNSKLRELWGPERDACSE